MAEIKTQTRRILQAGEFQYFVERGKVDVGFVLTNSSGLIKIPLDEFDDLVAFVNDQRKPPVETIIKVDTSDGRTVAQVVADKAPEDFIRETDETKVEE